MKMVEVEARVRVRFGLESHEPNSEAEEALKKSIVRGLEDSLEAFDNLTISIERSYESHPS